MTPCCGNCRHWEALYGTCEAITDDSEHSGAWTIEYASSLHTQAWFSCLLHQPNAGLKPADAE